jgi:large subunit ribosomal protein L13
MNVKRSLSLLGDDFIVIDGEGHVLGRLASIIAKRLLNGEKIVVVNAEKVLISGDQEEIFRRYKIKHDKGSKDYGPHFPKHPERILKRTVRGMLPHKTVKGREALSNFRAFIGIPAEVADRDHIKIGEALFENRVKSGKAVSLLEVSRFLGYEVKV